MKHAGQWNVASSGTFYETGSTCITHEGEELTPSVDLDYLPFTTEFPSCDGGTIGWLFSKAGRPARRTYVINYECRRRAAPVLQRTVEVRFPHRPGLGHTSQGRELLLGRFAFEV